VDSELENCQALDTGPGNMPLDLLAKLMTQGTEEYDPGGRLAAQGSVLEPILLKLLEHPYLKRSPPKTTGREAFGSEFVQEFVKRHREASIQDLLATMTLFVALSIKTSCDRFLRIEGGPREVVVSGGGVHNLTLLKHLKEAFFPVAVTSLANEGLDPDFKEALLFAVLANERILSRASNVPRITGARWPVCLGKISF
jgi:anhydro-N-acetylmuramic acid kinase